LGHESAPGLPPVGKVQVGFAEGGEVAADVLSARQIALVIARLLVRTTVEEGE
jgi:hypothetical protein